MNRIALPSACAALALLLLAGAAPADAAGCQLGSNGHQLKHIIFLQFDNVHLRRDKPEVPSDLEQIPSLLHFLERNGTLLTNHHTPLISHTSVDILTALTGVYGEKMGMPIGNSFGFFDRSGTFQSRSSFAYWTDTVNEDNGSGPVLVPEMVDQRGKVHPAPWVPFTRAGCDVGVFSLANMVLENTGTTSEGGNRDISTVFGMPSPEATEADTDAASGDPKVRAQPAADFDGIAIHCAKDSALCSGSTHARPDVLDDEPQPDGTGTGGYVGFQALFGNKYVAPALNGSSSIVINDLDGVAISDGPNGTGNPGFPGFDSTPSQALGYAAQMLEAGVPVVYLYIEDAHDNHSYNQAPIPHYKDGAFGPGEANYVFQLKASDSAFGKFFARLAEHGITRENTLFVVTADENDHFAGSVARARPKGCDGVHTPCTYDLAGAKGEVQLNLSDLLLSEFHNETSIGIDKDDAPGVWIKGNPQQTDRVTRTLERQASALKAFDPITRDVNHVMAAMADHAEQKLLHMMSRDPIRTPSFILFANPDYFLCVPLAPPCPPRSSQMANYAWNHGDFQEEITHTWLGIVGPGVRKLGRTGAFFTDHTDIRPTIISLAHLEDDYVHDGRVLFEVIEGDALSDSLRAQRRTLSRLAAAYKEINAPLGTLGRTTLTGISTQALTSGDDHDDTTYVTLESKIEDITTKRNEIAGRMIALLENAAFQGQKVSEREAEQLIEQSQDLLEAAR